MNMPNVGTELSIEEIALLTAPTTAYNGYTTAHMYQANYEFFKKLHELLRDNTGIWGHPNTMTFWQKTATGFRRTA